MSENKDNSGSKGGNGIKMKVILLQREIMCQPEDCKHLKGDNQST